MVASSEPLASEVGVQILREGGNAVDAAVAVGFALAVTHPVAGNIGGGGFMLIRLASGEAVVVDYREAAPAAASRNMYVELQRGTRFRTPAPWGFYRPAFRAPWPAWRWPRKSTENSGWLG